MIIIFVGGVSLKKVFLFLVLILTLILSACSSEIEGKPIDDFNFIDQSNEPFGHKDLQDKVSLVTFIYTYCPTECPMMTSNMAFIQEKIIEESLESDVQLVSFSIDPEVDKPEVLTEYGERFGADFNIWHFLTGYTQEEIEDFGPKNFKTIIKKPKNDHFVIHQFDFYLLNKKGEIISQYDGYNDTPFDQIMKDMKKAVKN